jgi:hypothetical protein
MDRREFLKLLGMVGLTVMAPWPRSIARAQALEPYDGPIFAHVAASGGWDPTSLCDPKMNVPGEREINNWSLTDETQTVPGSPIQYAPFANNQEFFERFAPDMLVVNGVDSQTNSHDAGVRNNWSGRISPGYPAFSAIAAAVFGDNLPLPFLTNGGYRETAGLAPYTEVSSTRDLQNLVNVNAANSSGRIYHDEDEIALVEAYQTERADAQLAQPLLLPRQRRALENLLAARASREPLRALFDGLPDELVSSTDKDGFNNPLLRQAHLALVSCSAGLTVAFDLEIGGFDTHQGHDARHRTGFMQLTNGIQFLWDTAEELGIADRLVVMVGSDFGRTPWYNDGQGKDHWPVTSVMLMKKNAPWGNRVIGASDEGHNTLPLDPVTLQEAPSGNGVVLTPADVQYALRSVAGVENDPVSRRFPLGTAGYDFFGGTIV